MEGLVSGNGVGTGLCTAAQVAATQGLQCGWGQSSAWLLVPTGPQVTGAATTTALLPAGGAGVVRGCL